MPVTEEPKTIGENANGGDFKEGICSCGGDCGSCMKATFCPCFVAKDVAEHMGESGSLWCALYCLGCCIGSLPYVMCVCIQRNKLRAHRGIDGNICKDCLAAMCCTPCAICQMHGELEGEQ